MLQLYLHAATRLYAGFFDACFHNLLVEICSCHPTMILPHIEEPSHNNGSIFVEDPCDPFLLDDCFYHDAKLLHALVKC